MNHTPGPLEVCNLTDVFTKSGATNAKGVTADDNDGWQVADMSVGYTFVNGKCEQLSAEEQRANAEFMVRAWNSHYDLLDAIEAAIRISALWVPCAVKPEHEEEAAALSAMEEKFKAAIEKARKP